jgi:hypothetical protein
MQKDKRGAFAPNVPDHIPVAARCCFLARTQRQLIYNFSRCRHVYIRIIRSDLSISGIERSLSIWTLKELLTINN